MWSKHKGPSLLPALPALPSLPPLISPPTAGGTVTSSSLTCFLQDLFCHLSYFPKPSKPSQVCSAPSPMPKPTLPWHPLPSGYFWDTRTIPQDLALAAPHPGALSCTSQGRCPSMFPTASLISPFLHIFLQATYLK